MNRGVLLLVVVVATIHGATEAQINPNPAPSPVGPSGEPPSGRLSRFLEANLDNVLAPLDKRPNLPRTELMQLREGFSDDLAKAAPNDRPKYAAALRLCSALDSAIAERDKAISDEKPDNEAPAVADTHHARVSLPRAHGRAARAAVRQQANENRADQREAAQKGAFLSTDYTKQWSERTIALRQQIQQLYSTLREIERRSP